MENAVQHQLLGARQQRGTHWHHGVTLDAIALTQHLGMGRGDQRKCEYA